MKIKGKQNTVRHDVYSKSFPKPGVTTATRVAAQPIGKP